MTPSLDALMRQGPVMLDGAWGTRLHALGLQPGESPDAWNLTWPDKVARVARDYVEAGSGVVLTNTFGANRLLLARHGLHDRTAAINREGAAISKRAAGRKAAVFASIGPSGTMLLRDDVTEDALLDVFREQSRALAEGGADGIVLETMADLTEAGLAIAAAKETGLVVAACMVFDSGRDGDRTMMGVTPERAAEALAKSGADIVGANCGRDVAAYVEICRRMRKTTDRPLWMKPNAGLPEIADGEVIYQTTPHAFAVQMPALIEAGADFIGGCCGTGPEHIRCLKKTIGQDEGRSRESMVRKA